ncbi:MAG: GntR family transcriptional regulator [Acidimicrobiia bacterium]
MPASDRSIQENQALAGSGYGGSRKTAHEFVREVLRRAILSGELTGATRLVQAELAATLEVSTTPVREALRDVASEGLIRFDPHRGAVVQVLCSDEVREVYSIRQVLEPLALSQSVPKITDAVLEKLRRLHQKMLDEPQSTEWVDYNRTFHMTVYESASPRLATIIRGLQDASVMYIGASLKEVPGLREHANQDHAAILEGLARRDVEAVTAAVLDHLQVSMHALEGRTPQA